MGLTAGAIAILLILVVAVIVAIRFLVSASEELDRNEDRDL